MMVARVRWAWLVFFFMLPQHARGAPRVERFALIAGSGRGQSGEIDLHYAQSDARKVHATLAEIGWFEAYNMVLLEDSSAETFRRRLIALNDRVRALRSASGAQVARIHHELAAGRDEEGLNAIVARHAEDQLTKDHRAAIEQRIGDLSPAYLRAVQIAERLGRPPRLRNDLRWWATAISVPGGDATTYWQVAPAWREQLERDSGLAAWRADPLRDEPGARLTRALQGAYERFQAAPEAERVYPVDEAIRLLAEYVAFSIAIGVRTLDSALLESLPPLLEPFAPLSPLLHALWQNVVGAIEANVYGHYERARERWIETHRKLSELQLQGSPIQHLDAVCNAMAYAIGLVEALLGLNSVEHWCEFLEQDPYQRLSALYLRKIMRLEQGDWSGAERVRRQAELLALQQHVPQMFNSALTVETGAHANAWDLVGLKQVVERQEAQAARYPGWVPYFVDARARFDLLRGDVPAAKSGFEQAIAMAALDENNHSPAFPLWVASQAGLAQCHFALEQFEAGRDGALEALAICNERGVHSVAFELRRVLALLEGRLGDLAAAGERLDGILAEQTALGTTGLRLGMTYEARARVAIWAGDAAGYEHYGRLTAREFRHGAHSPLGARYERLKLEALHHNLAPPGELSDFDLETKSSNLQSVVMQAMQGAQPEERSLRALQLVCRACGASAGHLYVLRPDGSLQIGSHGATAPPPDELTTQVRVLLERAHANTQGLTDLVTGTVAEVDSDNDTTVRAGGMTFELLLLACEPQRARTIVGVIALDVGEHGAKLASQSQLLATVAEYLVAS